MFGKETPAYEGTQVDVVSFDFVLGSYEPGSYHGVVNRLVIRECPSMRSRIALFSLIFWC